MHELGWKVGGHLKGASCASWRLEGDFTHKLGWKMGTCARADLEATTHELSRKVGTWSLVRSVAIAGKHRESITVGQHGLLGELRI